MFQIKQCICNRKVKSLRYMLETFPFIHWLAIYTHKRNFVKYIRDFTVWDGNCVFVVFYSYDIVNIHNNDLYKLCNIGQYLKHKTKRISLKVKISWFCLFRMVWDGNYFFVVFLSFDILVVEFYIQYKLSSTLQY